MKRPKGSRFLGILLASGAACAAAGCAVPNPDLAFFGGKTVTIVVPHGPGGMDTYAQAIAPYFQKYLPGSKVAIKNVPGEGSITGRNQVFAAAPDGLTLAFTTSAGSLLAEWARQPSLRYRTADFRFIGRINAETHILAASPKSGLSSLGDIVRAGKSRTIRMGFAGVGSDDYYVALITARLLGFRVEARSEYTSSFDAGLACVKGEVDAILFSESSVRPQIQASTLLPVAVFDTARLGSMPGVPTIFELIPADRRPLMEALVRIYALDRTLFAPPGIAAGRLAALRRALDKAVADPGFAQSMAAVMRPVSYLTGAQTAELLAAIMAREDQIAPLVLEIAHASR
jgi:tripartite-type tricarboxylate transporter receptor subunit TctC